MAKTPCADLRLPMLVVTHGTWRATRMEDASLSASDLLWRLPLFAMTTKFFAGSSIRLMLASQFDAYVWRRADLHRHTGGVQPSYRAPAGSRASGLDPLLLRCGSRTTGSAIGRKS
jgi:hypothetical protein